MKHHIIIGSSSVYISIALCTGWILRDGLIIFLGWNILLSTIPYLLSMLYMKKLELKTKKVYLVLMVIGFVLFFPNTFYVLTDVIHFQESQFFERYPDIYHVILKEWIGFFIIMYGVFQATLLGIYALNNMLSTIEKKEIKPYIITGIMILSSMGIYMGRFLRLNSWQFFRLDLIFSGIFESFSFFIGFIFIMTCLQTIIYVLITYVFHKEK